MSGLYSTARWVKRRAYQLSIEPLCRKCSALGVVKPATVADHIIPHRGDEHLFWNGDLQSLCDHCHNSAKKAEEARGYSTDIGADGLPIDPRHPWNSGVMPRRWAYSIPRGVQKSAIPVTLVCGPPASGKTTYVQSHARTGDTVIDLDDCLVAVGGKRWDTDHRLFRRAIRYRDVIVRSLKGARRGTAWLIASAPTRDERSEWAEALGSVTPVVLAIPEAVCVERIQASRERAHAASALIDGVRSWWQRYTP